MNIDYGKYMDGEMLYAIPILQEDHVDPLAEYQVCDEPDRKEKTMAWKTAIGLQAVDHLQTSAYLLETAKKNIEGEITLDQASTLIDTYYEEKPDHEAKRTEEADKVSSRIAQILSDRGFTFSAAQYLAIHKQLFTGIYSHAGSIRDFNISKHEWILDGKTVTYGSATELQATLEYDLRVEREFNYAGLEMPEIIQHLARFVSRLWQIHVFAEGNTRTTAVFFIKYLRVLGFEADNDTFAKNAWYFRNALVRANYSALGDGIQEDTSYLERFLRNLLMEENNTLLNRELHIRWSKTAFSSPKQPVKQPFQSQNSLFDGAANELNEFEKLLEKVNASAKTREHIIKLRISFGKNRIFGRKDIVTFLNITERPVTTLIQKMKKAGLIESITGAGKGRYHFTV